MRRFSKEAKIGISFLVSIVLLYIGLNFLKGSNVFSHENTYYTVVGNTGGVTASSAIIANGYQVGTVSRVDYDYAKPNRIVLVLRINEALRIPKGSRLLFVNSLLGGVNVELNLSDASDYYANGDTIISGFANGLTGQIENVMLPQVNALVPKIDSLVSALTSLVANPALSNSLSNVEDITHKLNRTADELNRFFYDELPGLMGSLQGAAGNIDRITSDLVAIDYAEMLSNVDSTIVNLQHLSSELTSSRNSVGRLLNDTAFYYNLNKVCTNANELIEDVKAHPSRYINISVFGKK